VSALVEEISIFADWILAVGNAVPESSTCQMLLSVIVCAHAKRLPVGEIAKLVRAVILECLLVLNRDYPVESSAHKGRAVFTLDLLKRHLERPPAAFDATPILEPRGP
jgi:hypothetical protein